MKPEILERAGWSCQESGWWTHPTHGGICRETGGKWWAYPYGGDRDGLGPFKSARAAAARAAAARSNANPLECVVRRCDDVWKAQAPDLRTIRETQDIRAYAFSGMWVHPCGKTFQEGGKDGFEKDYGIEHCDCKLCLEMWAAISDENA